MTVTANTTRNDYIAGSTSANQVDYEYTFQIHEASDVDVYLNGVKQTLNTHYTIDDIGNATGGTVTFTLVDANGASIPPPENAIINIVMAMDLDRDTNYQPSGAFLAADVNNDFDRLWLATNQQQTAVNRSLRLQDDDVTTSSMELPLKDARKGKLLAFNATTGDPEATSNNQSNWDSAYNDTITSASFSGGNYTLTQRDGGTITTSLDGRYLKLSGGNVTGTTRFIEGLLVDQNKAIAFNGSQLVMGTTGTESFIIEGGTGDLSIDAANLNLRASPTVNYITATNGGAVSLYHNNSVKLATTSGGISVTGTITATGYNSSNWDNAYNDKINSVSYSNNTLTLTQQDGSTLTTTIAGGGGSSLWSANNSDIYYNSGSVGIGTDSPARKLTVQGGSGDNLPVRVVGGSGTTKSHMEFQDASTTADYKVTLGSVGDGMSFQAGGSERLRIDSSGNVGIGTTSPDNVGSSKTLHINDNTNGGAIRLSEGNTNNAFVSYDDSNGMRIQSIDTIALKTANAERMRIDSSGKVGIGTSDPATALDVSGDITFSGVVNAGDGSASAPSYTFGDDTNTGMFSPAADTIAFSEGGVERMRITSSGKVGIGTTNPSQRLHVNGGVQGNRFIATSNNNTIASAGLYGGIGLTIKHVYSSSSTTYATMISFTNNSNGEAGRIRTHGSSTQYVSTSDERLKENIQDAGDAGSKIDAIRIRQFDWKGSGEHEDFGVIAQELQSVAPEAVSEGETADDMMGVDYSKLVPTLIKEIQSLRNRVAELENN
jgi:hypothetical protein